MAVDDMVRSVAELPLGLDLAPAFELVEKGGFVVVVLLLLSVVATTVVLFKVAQFTWLQVGSATKTERAIALWLDGDHAAALRLATSTRTPSANVLAHAMRGLIGRLDERILREDVERVALARLAALRANIRVLDVTVQVAPLLGLFGTVLGMISAFQTLQGAGSDADPTVLAGGIWVALLTTAVGLAIAIPVAFVSAWLEGRIEREQQCMEAALTSVMTGRATESAQWSGSVGNEPRLAHAAE